MPQEQIADPTIDETIAPEVSSLDTPAETETISEPKHNEKPQETAQRALRDLQGRSEKNGDQGETDTPKASEKAQPAKDGTEPKIVDDKDLDPELIPPQRLNAAEAKLFSNLPVGLKRALSRTVKNQEALTTRERQQYSQATQQARGIIEAVQPFAAEWGDQGHTVQSAIVALAAAHQKLMNPATSVQKWIEIGHNIGIDFEKLPDILNGNTANAFKQPENNPLQEKLTALENRIEQKELREKSEPLYREMHSVQHEVDPASGKFRFPELHDERYLDSLTPRVSELVGIAIQEGRQPSYGDALRQANAERKQSLFGIASTQPNQIRRPAAAQNIQERAASAAVTVRGKVNASPASNGLNGMEIPVEARKNAQETARWVEKMLSGRT